MADLHETAARVGAHRWRELAVWRLLGGWAALTDDPALAVRLDVHAQHAAWRAGQWWDRLPVLSVVRREALVRPPDAGLGAVVEHLGGPDAPASAVGRGAAAYRVLLPRVVAGYHHHGGLLVAASDGPVARTLGQVSTDAGADWLEGEAELQRLLVTEAAVGEAAATVATAERLAVPGSTR